MTVGGEGECVWKGLKVTRVKSGLQLLPGVSLEPLPKSSPRWIRFFSEKIKSVCFQPIFFPHLLSRMVNLGEGA